MARLLVVVFVGIGGGGHCGGSLIAGGWVGVKGEVDLSEDY